MVDDNDLKEQMNVRYSINPTSLSKIYKRIDIQPIDLDTNYLDITIPVTTDYLDLKPNEICIGMVEEKLELS